MKYTIKDDKGNMICSIENIDPTKSSEGIVEIAGIAALSYIFGKLSSTIIDSIRRHNAVGRFNNANEFAKSDIIKKLIQIKLNNIKSFPSINELKDESNKSFKNSNDRFIRKNSDTTSATIINVENVPVGFCKITYNNTRYISAIAFYKNSSGEIKTKILGNAYTDNSKVNTDGSGSALEKEVNKKLDKKLSKLR